MFRFLKGFTLLIYLASSSPVFGQFVTTWQTTDTEITIPTTGPGYNYAVTWTNLTNVGVGDGSTSGETGDYTIVGLADGDIYQLEISGTFPRIYFNNVGDKDKLLTIEQWGDNVWASMGGSFYGCSNLTIPALDDPDLSSVTDLSFMFAGAATFNADISSWDVSTVLDMSAMFSNASSFNNVLQDWDVRNVVDMSSMFEGATSFDQNINTDGTGNLWNVGAVLNMSAMFRNASTFNTAINNWNVSSVTDMSSMFEGASSFNQDVNFFNDNGSWYVGNVVDMSSMFEGATNFDQAINEWDVNSVTDMSSMFKNASSFDQDLETWNTDLGSVASMNSMFEGATDFTGDISGWIISSVTDVGQMFLGASSFNQDISAWDVSNVNTSMDYMFFNATSFNQNLGNWDITNITDMVDMLSNTNMSTVNYDATLIGWEAQAGTPSGINLDALGVFYCQAVTARAALIASNSWTINDAGLLCPPNHALDFDGDSGTGDHVNMGNPPELVITGDVTLEAWVNWDGVTPTHDQTIVGRTFQHEGIEDNILYQLGIDAQGKLFFHFEHDGGIDSPDLSSIDVMPAGEWIHVAAVRNATAMTVTLYLNGYPLSMVTDTYTTNANGGGFFSQRVMIGRENPNNFDYFDGRIDEVRIWNSPRTEAEIQANLWHPLTGAEANLAAYFNFNEGTVGVINPGVTTLPDLAPNVHDGTLINFDLGAADVNASNWVLSGSFTPFAPTDLFTTEVSFTQIDLNWTDKAFNETGFTIERSDGNNSSYAVLATVGIDVTSYSDNTVTSNNGYFYRVIANGVPFDSNPSNEGFGSTYPPPGHALAFDGIDDIVDLGNTDFSSFTGLTVEGWFKPSYIPSGPTGETVTLVGKGMTGVAGTSTFAIVLEGGGGGPELFALVDNGSNIEVARFDGGSGFDLLPNEWVHVALTWSDNSPVRLYVNAVEVDVSSNLSGPLNLVANSMLLGSSSDINEIEYEGIMDEVRIWDVERSQIEIANTMFTTPIGNEPDLFAYYRFDQGIPGGDNTTPPIDLLPDRSSKQHDGMLTGFTLNGSASNWVDSDLFTVADPTNLVTFEISTSQIDLSWTDNSSNETGFTIERSNGDNDFTIPDVTFILGANINTYSDASVTPGNGYFYRVIANGVPFDSNPSNEKFGSTFAPPGHALDFDGSDDFINLGNLNDIFVGSEGSLSIEFWFDSPPIGVENEVLLAINGSGGANDNQLLLIIRTDNQIALNDNTNTPVQEIVGPIVADNLWHHLAYTRDGSLGTLYLDGINIGTHTADFPINAGDLWSLGQEYDGISSPGNFYGGLLDEVRVWNSVRTEAEINTNLTNTLSGSESGLVAYYRFDQGIPGGDNTSPPINTLPDRSQNQNNGSLNNFTLNGSTSNWVNSNALTIPPAQPTGLLADATYGLKSPEVILTWEDNSTDELDFGIQRATDAGFTTGLQTMSFGGANAGASASYIDNTVSSGTLYFYRVAGTKGPGVRSAYSNTITAVPVVEAGNAASFDNTLEFINVTPSIQKKTDYTFTCWFKDDGTSVGTIYGEGAPASLMGIARFSGDPGIRLGVYNAGTWYYTYSVALIPNEWNFLAVSVTGASDTGGDVTMLLNNTVTTGTTRQLNHPSTVPYAVIGENVGATNGGSQPSTDFVGEVDEVSIWSRALDQTEMRALRDSGVPAGDPDLLHLWHFDEPNSSTTIYDASGNENHGTRTNNPQLVTSEALHPFAPQTFQVVPKNGQAEMQWEESFITDFKEYNVSYKLNSSGVYTTFQESTITNTTAVVTGLTNHELYDFKVSATDVVNQQGPDSREIHEVPEEFVGNAAIFDGINSAITIPDNAIFDRGSGLTLEGWIRPDNLGGIPQYIAGVSDAFGLVINASDQLEFFTNDGGSGESGTSALGLLTQGVWSHIAMTFEPGIPSVTEVYLDGVLILTSLTAPAPQNSTQPFTLGATSSGTQFFDGMVDEVRLWDGIVDNATLATLAYTPLRGDERGVGDNLVDLIGLWHMDEPTGHPTAYSTPTNLHNGVLSGNADFGTSNAMEIGGLVACDYNALIALYNATDGANWTDNTNWLSVNPVGTWNGVTIAGNRVEIIDIENNNLTGILPPGIGCLTALTDFDLTGNNLTGSIPIEVGQMSGLNKLGLDDNQLTGSIPTELGNLINLQNLHLGKNVLSGPIPTELGNSTNLTFLESDRNQLTGPIPVNLGNLTRLNYLDIDVNMLSGPIPNQLGNLTYLLELQLDRNQLTGSIPTELQNLANLQQLHLYDNQLSGPIPIELGDLVTLSELELDQNQLTGNIPLELGNLVNLIDLDLHDNLLTGSIPSIIENFAVLEVLELSNNQLSGLIPVEIGDLAQLIELDVSQNQFSGAVPIEIAALGLLVDVELDDNQFVDLPNFSALANLIDFKIANNNFHFDDVEPNVNITGASYSPQALIPAPDTVTFVTGSPIDVPLVVGGSVNQYQWVKDGVDVPGQNATSLSIPNATLADSGSYYLRVTSSLVPGLTLQSESILVTITSPEINVYVGIDNTGSIVNDGELVPFDFGTTLVGTDIDQTYAIENTGTSDLIINSITLTGTDFVIVGSPPTLITPASTQTFVVRLNSAATGSYSATLSINNSDTDEAVFDFPVIGTINSLFDPEIAVFDGGDNTGTAILNGQLAAVDLGNSPVGTDLSGDITIDNIGGADLIISAITAATNEFRIQNIPSAITAGSTETIVVTLSGAVDGFYTATISISNNDTDESVFVFDVTGHIQAAEIELFTGTDTTGTAIGNSQTEVVNFGETPQFSPLEFPFTIENEGDIVLNIQTITTDNAVFSVLDAPTQVQPGAFEIFTIQVDESVVGSHTALVAVTSDLGLYEFTVAAEVTDLGESPAIVVFNALSPNGDGLHDYFRLQNVEAYPKSEVYIYTKNGSLVYLISGYNNSDASRRFEGEGNQGSYSSLPNGTYYYLIDKKDAEDLLRGYLVLSR